MHQLNYNPLKYPAQRDVPLRISTATGLSFASLRPREDLDPDAWLRLRDQIFQQLDARHIPIEMLQYVERRVRFVCPVEQLEPVRGLAEELELSWRAIRRCVKLCVAGIGVGSSAGLFYRAERALRDAGISLLHFADSSATLSLLLQEHDLFKAESLLRRLLSGGDEREARSIHFDAELARVRVNGVEKRLGVRQMKLLSFLLENAGQIVRAEEIANHLFGASGRDELLTLRVHVHNLRKKIEENPNDPQYIMTVPHRGYVFAR